jgi:hypothetical protein
MTSIAALQGSELPVLEVLEAAGGAVPSGSVEVTGLLLASADALASSVEVIPPNGQPARSQELITGLFEALHQKRVRRHEGRFVLTSAGRRLLDEHGIEASAEARKLARWAAERDPEEVRHEAGCRLADA